MRACKCPDCGANLNFEDKSDFIFCTYCGTKIDLTDYRSTYRVINETRIKELDVELKRMEYAEKREREAKIIRIILVIMFFLSPFLLFFLFTLM